MTESTRVGAGLLILVVIAVIGLLFLFEFGKVASLPDFSRQSQSAIAFVVFCLADGVLTMVLIQLYRSLVPVRGGFHRRMLRELLTTPEDRQKEWANWIAGSPFPLRKAGEVPQEALPSPSEALKEFELKCNGGFRVRSTETESPIYDLPLEQFCAQLSNVAEASLDAPRETGNFLWCLVGLAGAAQLSQWRLFADESDIQEARARGALVRLIQRRIDAFHIATSAGWRYKLRLWVVSVSSILGILLALSGVRELGWVQFSYLCYGVVGGAMAGFLAMVFRDLTAIVELRRRQT